MPILELTESIALTDGTYQYVQHSGNYVRLRNTSDGSTVDMHRSELARRVVGLLPELPVKPRDLETFSTADRKRASLLADHLQELLTGYRPGATEIRPGFDPAEFSLEKRIALKIPELHKLGVRASRATIMRDLKELRTEGVSGLVDKRKVQKSSDPLANLDPRLKDCLCAVIAREAKRSTKTKKLLIDSAFTEYLNRYNTEIETKPSYPSMYRYLDLLTIGKHVTKSAKTRQSLHNRPARTFAKPMPGMPGESVQIDSTKLDILVRTTSGAIERPTLTVMVDIATRSILASSIRLEAKGVDHALLLAQSLTPPENRPDKSLFRAALRQQNPNVAFLDDVTRRQLELNRPFIRPRSVTTDLGKDFTSDVYLAALERHGIDALQSAPHTPTDKAIVERTFGSINTLFLQSLPGYTGRSPEHRGYKVEEEDLLDIHSLYELFDDWVLNVWQNRQHSGLRDVLDPAVKLSPNQQFLAANHVTAALELPLSPDEFIELLPTEYRVISSTGIEFDNRKYDSALLHPYRNTKSRLPAQGGKWEVKYDPYNPFAVWVRLPDGTWAECGIRNREEVFQPHAEDRQSARQKDKAEVAFTNAAITGTPMREPEPARPEPVTDAPETPVTPAESFGEFDFELE